MATALVDDIAIATFAAAIANRINANMVFSL